MLDKSLINKLELHYCFDEDDSSHSMDAVIRNRCEHELLQIVNTVSKELNIQIKTETEAFQEGGLKEFYTFFCSVEGQTILSFASLTAVILGIIISRIPIKKTKLDKQEQLLTIEEKRLNIEAQKINIEILKNELEEKKIQLPNINIENIEYIVVNNLKIIKHKSNFYKALFNYPKVKSLCTVRLNENKQKIEEPIVVERKDFEKFILESDNLKPIVDDTAIIEIISPVLKKGKYKWKGIYNKVPNSIEFSMKDKDFREEVIEDRIPFKSGSFIDCIIEISRKIDDLGNIFNSNYSVLTVLKQHYEDVTTETPQGRKYRQRKEADNNQIKLFGNED